MQSIFDHLTAILVGATLLGALLFVQMRQQQSAVETAVRDRAQAHASTFFDVAQREVENARTRAQAVRGLGYYVTEVQGTADRTDRFTFVTQEPPPPGTSGGGRMVAVSYRLVATGETVRVGQAVRPTYRIERWTNAATPDASGTPTAAADFTRVGPVATDVVSFVVRAYDEGGALVTWAGSGAGYGRPGSTSSSDDPVRFEIEVESASVGPERLAGDQTATTEGNLVRLAKSVRPVNVGAEGSSTVGGTAAAARNIPLLPGEPAPPSPPPSTGNNGNGGGNSGGGTNSGGGSGGGSSSPAPAPAPPIRPTPPAGVQV